MAVFTYRMLATQYTSAYFNHFASILVACFVLLQQQILQIPYMNTNSVYVMNVLHAYVVMCNLF